MKIPIKVVYKNNWRQKFVLEKVEQLATCLGTNYILQNNVDP